ncbi:MAG: hypothetical protein QNJ54_33255 [Prochloraceae cyanobacterium]|nr:hypothetical protein [Prochloraceae cyanobacterium]
MKRKKLKPIPMRAENQAGYQREIPLPNWDCFCCEDTGIAKNAAKMFIEGWSLGEYKLPVCQKVGCLSGEGYANHPDERVKASLDWRLDEDMCSEADEYEREAWKKWARKKQLGHNDSIFYREPFHSEGVNCEGTTVKKKGFPIKNKDIFSGKVDENEVIDFSTVVKSLRKRQRSQLEVELAQRQHLEERGK